MVVVLMALIAAVAVTGIAIFSRQVAVGRPWRPRPEALALGAVTNFFDTLGIGSFAPTMAWLRFRGLAADRAIPPTMFIGHGLPSILKALIFLALLGTAVNPWLLAGCVLAMFTGVTLGVRLVKRASLRVVRGGIAVALLIAGGFYAATNLGALPSGGTAATLPPVLMALALVGFLGMGVLINFGVGHYAPALVMFGLMGMDLRFAFPIMAAAGVLGMSAMALPYLADRTIDLRVVAGLAFGGVPAVLVAAFLVRSLPVVTLRWLVVAIVLHAAIILLHAALTGEEEPPAPVDLP